MEKKFKDLDLSNAFLFAAALEDPATCSLVLEIILGKKLEITKVHAEHSVLLNSDFRSVRFDLYASDEASVNYNVEAQNENEGNLPQRSRYYQAEMDVSSLKPGDDFLDLKPCYVIFICNFDLFGESLYRYTFEERCLERDISLNDGACRIFLNTKGTNSEEVPEALVNFLGYMNHSTDDFVSRVDDGNISLLHKRVTELKKSRELEARYMTGEELLRQRENKGRREGKMEGRIEGRIEAMSDAILNLLGKLGEIPESIKEKILSERNYEVLTTWFNLAADSKTIEEFVSKL